MTMQVNASEIRIPVPWGYIAAKSWGDPHGYPILAVHGRMDNAASFDKLAPLLPEKFFCIAVDLPGHGMSSHYPDGLPYHFMDMVTSLKRVVNYFKWESFYFVGHSFGGMIGSFFAAMYPELVKRLIMIDVAKPKTHPIDIHADLYRSNYEKLFEIEDKIKNISPPTYSEDVMLNKLIASRVTKLSKESAKLLLARSLKNVFLDKGTFSFSMDQKLKASIHVPLNDQQLCEILNNLRCEVLIVEAKESTGFFKLGGAPQVLEVYRQSCSYLEHVGVDGNHDVHMEKPEIVAPILAKFLLRKSAL